MRVAAYLLASLLTSRACFGQGTVDINNYAYYFAPPIDVPFFDDRGNYLAGANYAAQLYAGSTPEPLEPIGMPVPFVTNGYLTPMTRPYHQVVVTIPASIVGWGGPAWVQMRAWDGSGEASFEAAALAGKWTGISSLLFLNQTGHGGVNPLGPVSLMGLTYPGSPLIVLEPRDQLIRSGESASLSVVASGGITLSYQWYQGESGNTNQPIAGATNATYTTQALTTNSTFWVNIYDAVGSINSATATVTVYVVRLDVRLISGLPALTIDGVLNTPFRLEYSPVLNATNWTRLADISLYSTPLTLLDMTATNSATRFYRVSVP